MTPASRSRSALRRVCLAAIGLLYVASVPWYRDAGEPLSLWLGLPDWVAVALLCYVAVAILNGIAWTLTDVPEGESGVSEDGGASGSLGATAGEGAAETLR